MNQRTEQSELSLQTKSNLLRLDPFSRHSWRRGQKLYPQLRQQLIHDDCSDLDELDIRIALCIKMSAAFHGPDVLDKVKAALSRRFGERGVQRAYVVALNHQRRFKDALRYIRQQSSQDPEDTGLTSILIEQLFIAGLPGQGIQAIKNHLGRIAKVNRGHAQKLIQILIEAGRLDWLQEIHPVLTNRQPRARQATQLADEACDVPIYCISLAADHRRLTTTQYFLDFGGQFNVVEGVLGRSLPKTLKEAIIRGDPNSVTDAEVGCSLSHLKAWEMVARDLSMEDYALIVEDDARFMFGAPKGLNQTLEAAKTKSAGLVFVNSRACGASLKNLPGPDIQLANIDASSYSDPENWQPTDPGWGADGYLISGAVAQNLCKIWLEVGILGALDWQLNMMCHRELRPWHNNRELKNLYNLLKDNSDLPMIRGHMTNVPIVATRDHGFSSINAG